MNEHPFDADCWRCAGDRAYTLAEAGVPKVLAFASFRMYLCPECGDKRCAKATDHRAECSKGEGA